MDEEERRTSMEASENRAPSRARSGTALHRIDPGRVTETLASDGNSAGYARLGLMVGTIFERLVSDPGKSGAGPG
jgi:hypothetical protein